MDADILRDLSGRNGFDGLDPDLFGELRTDAEPGLANLANDIGMAAEQANALFLAKAEFTEANGDFRSAGKLLDANRYASADIAELKKLSLRTFVRFRAGFGRSTHAESKLSELRLSCKWDLGEF
jgi:hypothetical protein